jgi:hypothetical protein
MRHGHWVPPCPVGDLRTGRNRVDSIGFYPWVGVGVLALMAIVVLVMPAGREGG